MTELLNRAFAAAAALPEAQQDEIARVLLGLAGVETAPHMLTPAEQNEVFLCFCLASWPQWILQRCAGRWDTSWERKHRLLLSGLETLAAMRRRRRG